MDFLPSGYLTCTVQVLARQCRDRVWATPTWAPQRVSIALADSFATLPLCKHFLAGMVQRY